jgi:hypothetical protein
LSAPDQGASQSPFEPLGLIGVEINLTAYGWLDRLKIYDNVSSELISLPHELEYIQDDISKIQHNHLALSIKII